MDVCLATTYFQFEVKFYQQKQGVAMGNSISPVASNIFMLISEETALDTEATDPLSGSDTSTTLSWCGHMD
jgi:hypothetical protein